MEGDRKIMESGEVNTHEEVTSTKKGIRTFLSVKGPIYNSDGKVSGLFGVARDITERKKMEDVLKHSERLLNESQRLAKIGNWNFDLLNNKVTWSDELYNIFDIDKKEFDESHGLFMQLVDEKDRELVLSTNQHIRETGKPFNIQYCVVTKSGEKRFIEEHGYAERDSQGKLIRLFGTAQDITERKKAEDLYKTILDTTIDGFYLVDLEGNILDTNDAYCSMIGYSRDELLKMGIKDVEAIDTQEIIRIQIHHIMNTGPVYFETKHKSKDGRIIDIEASCSFQKDDNKRLFVFMRDITERKKYHEEIKASEARYRSLIEQATEGIFISDKNGNYIDVNPSGCLMLGYSREELLKLSAQDLVFEEDVKKNPPRVKQLLLGNIVNYERILKRKDGTAIEVEVRGKKVSDGRNIIFVHDITERKRAEEKIRQLSEAVEQSPATIVITDKDGNIEYANPMFTETTGYAVDEMIGKNPRILKSGFTLAPEYKQLWKTISSGKKWMGEFHNKKKNGEFYWESASISPILDEHGKIVHYLAIKMDITERKKAEEEIKSSEKKYRSLIEQASDAIFISDETGIYVDVNTSTCNMLGYTREEFLKFTIMDLVFKEDLEKNPIHFPEMMDGKMIHYERRLKRKDGTAVEVEITGKKIADGRNLVFARDISERKLSEEKLQSSEIRYRRLFEAAKDGILILDANTGEIKDVNPFMKEILGYSSAEFLGKQLWEIGLFKDIVANKEAFLELQEEEYIRYENLPLKTKEGRTHWVEFVSNVYHVNGNKVIQCNIRDITERKYAEEALMESELKYRGLVDNSPDTIVIYRDGKIEFVNNAAVNLLAAGSKEDLIGKSVMQFVHPDYKNVVIERMKKVSMEGIPVPLINEKFIRFDGSTVDVEVQSMPIMFQNKQAVQMIIHDITERKQAIDALRRSENRFKTLFEKASDGILIMDAKGKIVSVNESFARMHGYNVDELLSMSLRTLDTAEMARVLPKMIARVMAGETIHMDVDHYHKDGHIISLAISSSLIQVGNESYIQAFHTDITERKRALEEFQTTIKTTSDGFWIVDIDTGKFLDVNESYCKMTGYSKSELLNMSIPDIEANESRQEVKKHSEQIEKKGNDTFITRHKAKSGKLIDVEVSVTYSGNIKGRVFVFVRDITERIKAEKEIKNTAIQLRQLTSHLQRVREEERKRIGREIHDELGQQLTAIKMDAAWVDKKTPEQEKEIKNKLKNIISLLDVSNLSVRKILSELKPAILDDGDLPEAMKWQNRQFTDSTGIPVEFDSTRTKGNIPQEIANSLFRVYQESLTNIAKYAKAGKVSSSLISEDDNIVLRIQDDGKGFDTDTLVHKRTFGILGMKERVFSLNGKFKLSSAPGKGTKIKISIPVEKK